MPEADAPQPGLTYADRILAVHLRWAASLRWIVAAALAVLGAADIKWFHFFESSEKVAIAGLFMAVYNVPCALLVRRQPSAKTASLLAHLQVYLDVLVLMLAVYWTGAADSPLLVVLVPWAAAATFLRSASVALVCMVTAGALLFVALVTQSSYTFYMPTEAAGRQLLGWLAAVLITIVVSRHFKAAYERHAQTLSREAGEASATGTSSDEMSEPA